MVQTGRARVAFDVADTVALRTATAATMTGDTFLPLKKWIRRLVNGPRGPREREARIAAEHITTTLEWDDLVLRASTAEQLEDVVARIRQWQGLMDEWKERRYRFGFRCLFHGPPGSGKTKAALVLGKQVARDVYRIDLSSVMSKYIGETEKNLESIFSRAEQAGDWILLFDEADALFGKRTELNDAHDRYADQETAYLLQRIEQFPGVVILASNVIEDMDDAFLRRLSAVVQFALPDPE